MARCQVHGVQRPAARGDRRCGRRPAGSRGGRFAVLCRSVPVAKRSTAGFRTSCIRRVRSALNAIEALVPGGRIGRRRIPRPVVPWPFESVHVLRVDGEIEEVFLRQPQVFEQLPRGMLETRDLRAAHGSWNASDGLVEADVGLLPVEEPHQVGSERIERVVHHRILSHADGTLSTYTTASPRRATSVRSVLRQPHALLSAIPLRPDTGAAAWRGRVLREPAPVDGRSPAPVQRVAARARHDRPCPGRALRPPVRAQGAGSRHPRGREPPALRADRKVARSETDAPPDHRPALCGRRRVRRAGAEGRRYRACPRRRSRRRSSIGRPTTTACDRGLP